MPLLRARAPSASCSWARACSQRRRITPSFASRLRHPERAREEPHFEAAFRALQARGLIDTIEKLPRDVVLEGAGDCVFDATRNLFWMGYGPRSDAAARHVVADIFGQEVAALE